MTSPKSLDDRLNMLSRQIVRARALYDLWWLCVAKEHRESYRPAFERYGDLFRFLDHGLLVATVVQASIPFDRNKQALSLLRLVREVAADGALTRSDREALISRVNTLDDAVQGIRMLRHKAFAHLSHAMTYDEVFSAARVRPMDIRGAIDEALAVINVLRAAKGLEPVDRNEFPQMDGLDLLKDVSQWIEAE